MTTVYQRFDRASVQQMLACDDGMECWGWSTFDPFDLQRGAYLVSTQERGVVTTLPLTDAFLEGWDRRAVATRASTPPTSSALLELAAAAADAPPVARVPPAKRVRVPSTPPSVYELAHTREPRRVLATPPPSPLEQAPTLRDIVDTTTGWSLRRAVHAVFDGMHEGRVIGQAPLYRVPAQWPDELDGPPIVVERGRVLWFAQHIAQYVCELEAREAPRVLRTLGMLHGIVA